MKETRFPKSRAIVIKWALCAVFLTTSSCSSDRPEIVVRDFNQALFARDKTTLAGYLVNEPRDVAERSFAEYKRIYPDAVKERPTTGKQDGVAISASLPTLKGDELVDRVIPTTLFFGQRRWNAELKNAKINGDDAVVTVEYSAYDDSGTQYVPLRYDILLRKEREGWKVFMMNARRTEDEAYYTYRFFAQND